MRQRLAIGISGLVAAAVLAVGLTAAGFGPEPRPATAEEPTDLADQSNAQDLQPEVVYVRPAPEPKTVVVKERVKSQSSGGSRASITRTRAARAGDDDEAEERREHRRESAKERREDRRERAKERSEHEDDDEDDD